jgi:hypothetical protein
MKARLLCRVGPLRGADFELDREATLGRHPQCTVVLPVPAVSGRHARIAWDEAAGSYFLEDLGSLNGTELDGEPLNGRERLDRLHVITLGGKLDLIFQGPELCARRVAAEDVAAAATIIDERPAELPPALGTPPAAEGAAPAAGSEATELDLEVVPLPPTIGPDDPDPTTGDG